MEENKDLSGENASATVESKPPRSLGALFGDIGAGFAMGIAFIIPGFSGGSVAAILGVYEKLIGAIAELPTKFMRSVKTLLPIGLGLVLGVLALLFPLKLALSHFPLPTVSLFVGLAIGGMPSVTCRLRGKVSFTNIIALSLPLLCALLLSFAPTGAEVDLFSLDPLGYLLLFAVGLIGSCALVIPGISGSMLLLILGYYNPLLALITDHLLKGKSVLTALSVLSVAGLGIIVGFFIISLVMKKLLTSCPRGTYFAITGFIIGSLPTVFVSTAKDAGYNVTGLPTSVIHYVVCVLLLGLGFALAFLFTRYASREKQ